MYVTNSFLTYHVDKFFNYVIFTIFLANNNDYYFFLFVGNTVFVQGAAATPIELLDAMTEFGKEKQLKDVTVAHMHTEGNAGYHDASCEGMFRCVFMLYELLHKF